MRTLMTCGLALAFATVAQPAMAAGQSAGASAVTTLGKSYSGVKGGVHRWGPRHQGRWLAGHRAPGGWVAYRRPVYGYMLPRYWIQPSFYISNYATYGLYAPRPGYGWSRYYDDAVLTDRYGRVYDSRSDVHWDRYEGGYDDSDPYYDYDDGRERRDDGVGGAVIGAVVGGVAGNVIAGRGNRTEGTLIGAGVGAVAGLAIDKAEDKGKRRYPQGDDRRGGYRDPRYDYGHQGDDGVTYNNEYSGRWEGTWYGDDGRVYKGEYDGTYKGTVRGKDLRAGADYDAPPYRGGHGAHWSYGDGPPQPQVHGGYFANGYYYPAPTITTITITPATTTTTTYVEEKLVYAPQRKAWKPKAAVKKPCLCK